MFLLTPFITWSGSSFVFCLSSQETPLLNGHENWETPKVMTTWNPNDLYFWRSTPKTRSFPTKKRVIWVPGTFFFGGGGVPLFCFWHVKTCNLKGAGSKPAENAPTQENPLPFPENQWAVYSSMVQPLFIRECVHTKTYPFEGKYIVLPLSSYATVTGIYISLDWLKIS